MIDARDGYAHLIAPVAALIRDTANSVILPRYQQLAASEITEKTANDHVTVADLESEARLSSGLAHLLPEAQVVGEEAAFDDASVLERLRHGLVWIIDPLDGTNNFAEGRAPFGVLIALARDGETVAGWIYDVLSGRLCHTLKGAGAFVNGAPVMAQTTGKTPPVAAMSTLYLDPVRRDAMQQHIASHYTMVDIPRCAAEQYPRLVLGTNDVALFERTMPWDHAAGALFVTEAGGKVSRPDGRPYRVDQIGERGLVAASSPALCDAMVACLLDLA